MTTLLLDTFEHCNRHSFRCKPNNLPIKKSCVQLSKSSQKFKNFDFQSQFFCVKNDRICLFFFSLNNIILGAHFLILTVVNYLNFVTTLFNKMTFNFWPLSLNWPQDFKNFFWQVVGFGPTRMSGRMCEIV